MTRLFNFDDWINLAKQNTSMVTLQAATCDRPYILQQFLSWSEELTALLNGNMIY